LRHLGQTCEVLLDDPDSADDSDPAGSARSSQPLLKLTFSVHGHSVVLLITVCLLNGRYGIRAATSTDLDHWLPVDALTRAVHAPVGLEQALADMRCVCVCVCV
jgi:hypothetical protein